MWFILLGIGLAILATGGIYFRRRLGAALTHLGVSQRRVRIFRWVLGWFLWGYPILVFLVIGIMLLIGSDSFPRPRGVWMTWLLVYPFFITLLVMLQSLFFYFLFDALRFVLRRTSQIKRLERYHSIGVLAVASFFLVYTPTRIIIEAGALEVREFKVGSGNSKAFRIAFLADLQQDEHTDEARAKQVVALLNQKKPDIVLSGGDWINSGPDHIQAAARSAGHLRSRLGTYSVRGDHEHFAYRDRERSVQAVTNALRDNGAEMLDNDIRYFSHEGKRIGILFLSYNYIVRTKLEDIRPLVDRVSQADYSIIVSHQFDAKLADIVKDKVNLVLSAHTHGGQVNPVVGAIHFPLARVETEFVNGRYQLGKTVVIVTAGVGFSIVPFRYASPASIEVIDLYP